MNAPRSCSPFKPGKSSRISVALRPLAVRRLTRTLALAVLLGVGARSAPAQTYTYTGNGGTTTAPSSGNFSNGFTDGTTTTTSPVSRTDTTLVFGGSGGIGYVANDDILGTLTLNSLLLKSTDTVPEYITANTGNVFSFAANGSANPTITQSGTGTFIISAPLDLANTLIFGGSGTGLVTVSGIISDTNVGVTKNSMGTLLLSGVNTYTGGTVLNVGQITLRNSSALGSGTLTMANGTTLRMETVNGDANGGATISPANAVALSSGATAMFTSNNANNGYGGVITGGADSTLEISGMTQVSLSAGANTQQFSSASFLGTVLIDSNSSLRFSATSSLNNGGSSATFNVLGNLAANAGTVNVGALTGTGSVLGSVGRSGATIFSVGAKNANSTFGGTIADSATNQYAALTKVGTGTLTLTNAANAYTGGTTINGGTLSVSRLSNGSSSSSIGVSTNDAANLVINGGTLQYMGSGTGTDRLFTVGGTTAGSTGTLDASGTSALVFSNGGPIAFGTVGQTRTLVLTGASTAANALLPAIGDNGTGTTSVIKTGAGTWVLAGANTYSGGTTVSAGTLTLNSVAASNALSTGATGSGPITVSGAGISSAASATQGVLQLAASDRIYDAAAITLNGGTLNTQQYSETAMGTLTLLNTNGTFSFLDYGTGNAVNTANSTLAFAGSGTTLGSGLLRVVNYQYGAATALGTASANDHLFIGTNNFTNPSATTLTQTQLAQITFINPNGTGTDYTATQLASGEVVPGTIAPTPEPGGLIPLVLGIAGTGVLIARRRRKMADDNCRTGTVVAA